MNKFKKINIYYFFLVLILGFKIINTVFNNSLSVDHGKKIHHLEIQKNNLLQQELKLNEQLAEQSSLSYLEKNVDLSEYISISNPIIIHNSNTVALK